MHAVLFAVKRVHHLSLRIGRRLLERTGLTPARFDLVQAMAVDARGWGKVRRRQSDLWKTLGVSRTTVSRMVQGLETSGFVRRFRSAKDRRQIWVELTREGAAALRLARRLALAPAARVVEALLPGCGYRYEAARWEWGTHDAEAGAPFAVQLARARRMMRDRASLVFPSFVADASPRLAPARAP